MRLKRSKSNSNKGIKARIEGLGQSPIYNLILVLIVAIAVIHMLNIIIANQIIHEIRHESLDYEAFREMKISTELIEKVLDQNNIGEVLHQNVDYNKEQNKNYSYDDFDMLTLYMLIYNYDTREFKKINKRNSDLILRSLVYDETFRELKDYYVSIFRDIETFPVLQTSGKELNVTFDDSWNAHRTYGGDRRHEGTDLMAKDNVSGKLRIISMSDGVVEKKAWLELGGYRIGIRSENGTYFYYAHLDSYNDSLEVGDRVKAGDFLGFMGDTGYGPEGTTGQFDVHLHLGIYIDSQLGNTSINPYYILDCLQNNTEPADLSMTMKK